MKAKLLIRFLKNKTGQASNGLFAHGLPTLLRVHFLPKWRGLEITGLEWHRGGAVHPAHTRHTFRRTSCPLRKLIFRILDKKLPRRLWFPWSFSFLKVPGLTYRATELGSRPLPFYDRFVPEATNRGQYRLLCGAGESYEPFWGVCTPVAPNDLLEPDTEWCLGRGGIGSFTRLSFPKENFGGQF